MAEHSKKKERAGCLGYFPGLFHISWAFPMQSSCIWSVGIQEIQEKTPADPLEAEILMMAAAVSADGKNSSDSDTEEEVLPEISSEYHEEKLIV